MADTLAYAPPRFEVKSIQSPEGALSIRQEWEDLLSQGGRFSGSQTPEYALCCWNLQPDRGARPQLITVRRGPELVCAWPLLTRRAGPLRIASHPGRGGDEEYAGPVIRRGPDAAQVAALALRAAKANIDVLGVFNVRRDDPIAAAVEADGGFSFRSDMTIPLASLGAWPDSHAWLASKTRNFRGAFGRYRRRLERVGAMRFERVTGEAPVAGFLAWLFERKQAMVDRLGVRNSWIRRAESRTLFSALLAGPEPSGRTHAFALSLNGRIAAGAVFFQTDVLELVMIAYDEAFAALSPGLVLLGFCAEEAIERGLDIDFRLGREPYKQRWADRFEVRSSYQLAASPLGAPFVARAHARGAIREMRRRLGAPVRRLLKR